MKTPQGLGKGAHDIAFSGFFPGTISRQSLDP